jgi:thioesterase domain-containing protein
VDPDAELASLGVDSMSGIQLRKNLMAATDVEFPLARMIDHPTARHLATLLDSLRPAVDRPTPATPDSTATSTLARLTVGAARRGALLDAVAVVRAAARLAPTAHSPADLADPRGTLLISDGPARPQLVGVPSFLAGSGPHQFAALAAGFPRRHRMSALTLPGFAGTPLPATWADVIEAVATTARDLAGADPVILVGHSVGGILAHAAAAALGAHAAGVVLIDTFGPTPDDQDALLSAALNDVIDRDSGLLTDANLLAMGRYIDLFTQWRPPESTLPTLLLAAATNTPSRRLGHQPRWHRAADTALTVPGDHFSLLEAAAATTASAIQTWITAATGTTAGRAGPLPGRS